MENHSLVHTENCGGETLLGVFVLSRIPTPVLSLNTLSLLLVFASTTGNAELAVYLLSRFSLDLVQKLVQLVIAQSCFFSSLFIIR
jgi:hypothetical protein